jgi:hypothetical protein
MINFMWVTENHFHCLLFKNSKVREFRIVNKVAENDISIKLLLTL